MAGSGWIAGLNDITKMWRASEIRWPCVALVAIVAAMALRPGDSPWFFDMSRNFDLAIHYNATPSHPLGISLPFTPSPYALKGTHGIRYGPLPVWIDQVFLSFTSNLLLMTVIRTVAVGGLTALALLWISQLLRVSPWLAVAAMLSPWIWYYSRQLWDNSLAIPLSALLLAAYGQFLESRRAWPLCLAIVCATLAGLTHLVVAPFVAVLTVHLVFFETRWLLKFKWVVLATVVVMFAISLPYLRYALSFHGSNVPEYFPRWRGWVFSFLGAQHLTAKNVGYFVEESWDNISPAGLRYAFKIAQLITFVAFIACWTGMFMGITRAWKAVRKSNEAGTIDKLCLVGLGTFGIQTIFDGIEHVSFYPHYYNTTWIIYVMFAWLAFDALPRWFGDRSIVARLTIPVYAMSLLFVEVIVGWQIARNGGSKGDHYSAVLSNQIEVVKEIGRFSDASPIDVQVEYWQTRPDALRVLRQLVAPPKDDGPVRRLIVRFRDAFPGDARIIVDNYPISKSR
jgi:hypothetical protein